MRALLLVALGCAFACTKSARTNDLPDLSDSTLACPALANYCDHAYPWAPCEPTLDDAHARLCSADGGIPTRLPQVADCGSFRVLHFIGVDGSEDFYYDAVTGALVAIIGSTANFGGSSQCDGGPATFSPPTCQPFVAFCN